MTVSTGKMSESPEPLWEPWRTEGGAEQKTGKVDSLVKLPAELPIISKQCNIVSLLSSHNIDTDTDTLHSPHFLPSPCCLQ